MYNSTKEQIAIYLHWPFCKSKCPYCDFNSHVREGIDVDSWNQAYINEINSYKELLSSKKIVSIFFGGGTPSLMPSFIVENIIEQLYSLSTFDSNIEITLEANPTSVESDKFKEFSKIGVNRVSLGIQSLNQDNLKFLGREHNVEEATRAIELASKYFKRYSFDLIYALPNQTIKSWEDELNKALKLAGNHLSLYQLTIEKGTSFYSLYQKKKFEMPSDDLARDFYGATQDIMEAAHLPAYEISNHAKHGEECKHNLVYWQYNDFLGIGPGAHSRLNQQAIYSIYNPESWLELALNHKNTIQNKTSLSPIDIIHEIFLMGLRLTEGIEESEFINKTGKSFAQATNKNKLDQMIKNKLLNYNNGRLSPTKSGKLVLNKILEYILDH